MSAQPDASLQAEVNRLRLQLESLQAKDGSEPIAIGDYLLARLEQLKVTVGTSLGLLLPLIIPARAENVWCPWRFQSRIFGKIALYLYSIGVLQLWWRTRIW
jgi:hypothetical protein